MKKGKLFYPSTEIVMTGWDISSKEKRVSKRMRLKLFAVRRSKLSKRMKRINIFLCGENEFYRKNWKCYFLIIYCVLNTSTLPWTLQKAFPTTTCLSAVSPEPPNHNEPRSPVPPPESSYNEPGWGAAGLCQDHRLLSATRSPLIRRHAPRDCKWKRILQMICIVGSYS